MLLNENKIISIIREECAGIDERCDSYRETLVAVISEILVCEREHKVSATNIQQKINEKFNTTADLLAKQRGQHSVTEERTS